MVSTCLKAPAPIEASPGPWGAEPSLFRHGAAYIEDADGELIGWATDTAGHTTEDVGPDRRDPRQTLLNGFMMSLAPQALAALLIFVETAPGVAARLRGSGQPSADLLYAQFEAEKVVALFRRGLARAAERVPV